jgi:uncharacterized protein (DUF2147 family)
MKNAIIIYFLMHLASMTEAQNNPQDAILGKWMNAEKDLAVEIYQYKDEYRAKVIWFDCFDGTKMSDYTDKKNPVAALKSRPWLGMEVLNGLSFKTKNEWHKGHIYDPNTGNTFRSVCRLEKNQVLKVRGYWLYEWIGTNLVFNRMSENQKLAGAN